MENSIRAIVIDDHPLYREGVVWTLGEQGGISVLAEGASAEDAFKLVEEYNPDVVLLDITIPGGGINAAGAISKKFPYTKIIMLTVSEEPTDMTKALINGAHGYLVKGIRGAELVDVVQSIVSDRTFISCSLATHILNSMNVPKDDQNSGNIINTLTEREEYILGLVAEGMTNEDVGKALDIREHTVVDRINSIRRKFSIQVEPSTL